MRILDLFSGAGGCSAGYAAAGMTPVGVDLDMRALRRYPYPAVCMDAMTALDGGIDLDAFDAIHASPPCQAYSITRHTHSNPHPDLLQPVHDALAAWGRRTGRPWIIENVPGATIPGAPPLEVCGALLRALDPATGLRVRLRRHRLFWSNVWLWAEPCTCDNTPVAGVYGGGSCDRNHARNIQRGGYTPAAAVRADLMGIDWMTQQQLNQAIPPAYTEYIGRQIMDAAA
jgi:DNA (cytosine-5)-methyltransferase 1